jgi:hypothetical protein
VTWRLPQSPHLGKHIVQMPLGSELYSPQSFLIHHYL